MSNNRNSNVDYNQKVLEVNNLKKHFIHGIGKNKLTVPAVDGLTFDIYKREVFGLVGESGCGKTTTGRTIIKLLQPTEGTVKLNGEVTVAGFMDRLERIKEIKEETTEKILSFDPKKSKIAEIKKELDKQVLLIESDINQLKVEQKQQIDELQQPLRKFKEEKYHAKAMYQLDVEKINYDYKIAATNIHKKTVNPAQAEYEKALSGAKVGYKRKVEGLKDSAALKEEVIKRRIQELTEEYNALYEELKERYAPQIADQEKNIISKKKAKEELNALKAKRKQQIAERKVKLRKEQAAIVAPDKAKIRAEVAKVKAEYKNKINALQAQIKSLKEKAKADIAAIPENKEQGVSQEEINAKINEIKQWSKEAIQAEKDKIKELKAMNKSQEALEMSRKMQMIFQDPISSLNPRMTVQEIVGEGLTIVGGYTKDEIKERVGEVLELVGLSREYATRYPHEFSGGQRQRIGVARALIMDPDFIIADEPISALDVSIRAQVINLLSELKERLGLTILFIAHDLSVVQFFCDRIAVMYYGKIVELASSKELFENPMHPYTRSLLSSIPQPDPDYEKGRKRIEYNTSMHDYRIDKPSLREIAPGHMVYCNDKEFAQLKEEYAKNNAKAKTKEVK
jgi:oligopeptide transport system ATP-binding protein